MPRLTSPLRFDPFLRPVVWGGRRLATVLGKNLPTEENYGESWELSDHPSHRTRLAAGPLRGLSLHDLVQQHPADLLGPAAAKHATFPWLVKFLDARDWLSIQVHPDDATVQALLPGEGGKTEAWFILDAAPSSRIWAGLIQGVTPERLRQSLHDGSVVDLLHSFEPRPGQCVFLPAGTVHAVGGGVLMTEIQQTSDATFRLFDWNRVDDQGKPRTLHIEQALAAIDWSRGPVGPIVVDAFPGLGAAPRSPLTNRAQQLVDCPFFRLSYVQGTAPLEKGAGRLRVLILLAGRGRFSTGEPCAAGEVWLLPAAAQDATLTPDDNGMAFLLASLP